MKLPKKYNFRDTQNPNVSAIVDDKECALCYVTKKLSRKENAELLIEGYGEPEGGASGSVVFDEKDEKSFTRLRLEYVARKLSCKGASLENPFIIACDDVLVEGFFPMQVGFQSSLKKKKIEFEKFVFGTNNIDSVHFGETEHFGTFNVTGVFGQGNVKISGTPDRLADLSLKNIENRITLDFAYHPHTTADPNTRNYSITNSYISTEKTGRSKKTVLKFTAGDSIEITNVNLQIKEGTSEAFIKSSHNFKLRASAPIMSTNEPCPLLCVGAFKDNTSSQQYTTNVANFEAELRTLPSNYTQHTLYNLDAPNVDILIKQSLKPEYRSEDAMRIGHLTIRDKDGIQASESAKLKINDTINCIGYNSIILNKDKELEINRLDMSFSSILDLSSCNLTLINELYIEKSYVDGITVSNESDEYLGKLSIESALTDFLDGLKNPSIDKNCNVNIYLSKIVSPKDDKPVKYYLENLKFSGRENYLEIELGSINNAVSGHLKNCEFSDAKCDIRGNKTVVLENSFIGGENLFDNVSEVKDSEISDSTLVKVGKVFSSNIRNSKLESVNEILSSETEECSLSNVEQINGYLGYGEKHCNVEKLIERPNITKGFARGNDLKIVDDKNARDIEL